jgi:hypothetical protein
LALQRDYLPSKRRETLAYQHGVASQKKWILNKFYGNLKFRDTGQSQQGAYSFPRISATSLVSRDFMRCISYIWVI